MTARARTGRRSVVAAKPPHDDHPTALWASARVTGLLGEDSAPLPRYGTREWQQLPDTAPHKVAAVITAAELWRKYGDEDGLLAWFREARHARPPLASRKTLTELNELGRPKPARAVQAAPGWPPVAIPGRPGWWRHRGSGGEQVDLPHNNRSGAAAA